METDDLILISVDDHLIEPPDLFVHHLDAEVPRPGAQARPQRRGLRRLEVRRVVMETAALNAVAGRPKEEYGMEPQSLDEVRPGCYDVARAGEGHGRRRRAGLDELPVVPHLHGPRLRRRRPRPVARPGAGLQRLAHRRVVRRAPGPVHPDGRPRDLGRRADRGRGPPLRGQGLPLADFTENPAALGYPSFHDDYWDPLWKALRRHRHGAVDPPRLVGPARHPGAPTRRPT